MARITVPEGDGGELVQVWSLSPDLGAAVGNLAPPSTASGWCRPGSARSPACASRRSTAATSASRGASPRWPTAASPRSCTRTSTIPTNGDYSEQERLAIEYADKFALDHRSLDDAFFVRMRAEFTDAEIVELTAMIGNWLAFGRFQAVLDVAEACALGAAAASPQRRQSDGAHRRFPARGATSSACGRCRPTSAPRWAARGQGRRQGTRAVVAGARGRTHAHRADQRLQHLHGVAGAGAREARCRRGALRARRGSRQRRLLGRRSGWRSSTPRSSRSTTARSTTRSSTA